MSERVRTRKSLEAQATDDLAWFFNYAEGEACGMVAAHYRVLGAFAESNAEIDEKGFVRKAAADRGTVTHFGAVARDDPFPDERSFARQRLRRVWSGFRSTPGHAQSVLEAFYLARPNRENFKTLEPEWLSVAATLPEVQIEASRQRVTRLQAAKELVLRDGANEVRAKCRAVFDEAFAAFVEERFPQLRLRDTREAS